MSVSISRVEDVFSNPSYIPSVEGTYPMTTKVRADADADFSLCRRLSPVQDPTRLRGPSAGLKDKAKRWEESGEGYTFVDFYS